MRIPGDGDHRSGVIAITIPRPSQPLIGTCRKGNLDGQELHVEKSLTALDT
jgi:hypothetical protein